MPWNNFRPLSREAKLDAEHSHARCQGLAIARPWARKGTEIAESESWVQGVRQTKGGGGMGVGKDMRAALQGERHVLAASMRGLWQCEGHGTYTIPIRASLCRFKWLCISPTVHTEAPAPITAWNLNILPKPLQYYLILAPRSVCQVGECTCGWGPCPQPQSDWCSLEAKGESGPSATGWWLWGHHCSHCRFMTRAAEWSLGKSGLFPSPSMPSIRKADMG